MFFTAALLQAQFSVNFSIGAPPMWGPVGYSGVQYYYLPDVEAYYDVHSAMFIYFGDGAWVRRSSLPARYKNYDLYHGYKVVMKDYHGNTPYSHFKEHKMKYGRGYNPHDQRTIGERPGNGNPRGNAPGNRNNGNREKDNKNDNNRGNGHGHGKNK